MRICKRILSLILSILLLGTLPVAAFAHDVPQDIPGSIEVSVQYGGKAVSGGTITCIQVGEVCEENGNYSFRRCVDEHPLTDMQSPELAGELERFAKDNQLTGKKQAIGSDGTAAFTDLKIGVYLLVQETPAEGYTKLKPFLVTVPYMENGKYVYDVTAQIKSELERTPETEPSAPTTPSEPKLPQTGQLNWPVPLLAVLGLGLLSIGWLLCFGKKKDGYEK